MKRFLSLIIALLMTFSLSISVQAKPLVGGTTTFTSKIDINPATATVNVGGTVTLTATWSANLGINRTEWSVDGISKTTTSFKTNKLSGTSSYTYTASTIGKHEIKFRVWNSQNVGIRDAFQTVSVIVNATTLSLNYVSLGDSIATGTTTPLTAPTKPYVDQFQSYLATKTGSTVLRKEFETNGDRTNELLSKLINDTNMQTAISEANVITVSIGGNNLMQACLKSSGFYDFFNPDMTKLNQGYADFVIQWKDIMSKIHTLNPNAVVIAMNQYNPYNTTDTTMHNLVDSYYYKADGTGMNNIINDLASTYNYKVADVFSAFDAYSNGNMDDVTLLYPASLLRNPHPNQFGQNIIFDLHRAIYDDLK